MKKRVILNMTLDPDLKVQIQAVADRTNRTLSNVVETALFDLVKFGSPSFPLPTKESDEV